MRGRGRFLAAVLTVVTGVVLGGAGSARAANDKASTASIHGTASTACHDVAATTALNTLAAQFPQAITARGYQRLRITMARTSVQLRKIPASSALHQPAAGLETALERMVHAPALTPANVALLASRMTALAAQAQSKCHLPERKQPHRALAKKPAAPTSTKAPTKKAAEQATTSHKSEVPEPHTATSCSWGRVIVPKGFRIHACWDGSDLTLQNTTQLVVQLKTSGDQLAPERKAGSDATEAARITAAFTDADTLPPGYSADIVMGQGASKIDVVQSSHDGEYAVLLIIGNFLPVDVLGDTDAIEQYLASLSSAMDEANTCLSGANFIKKAVCSADLAYRVSLFSAKFAGKVGVKLGQVIAEIAEALWTDITGITSVYERVKSANSFTAGTGSLSITAAGGINAGGSSTAGTTSAGGSATGGTSGTGGTASAGAGTSSAWRQQAQLIAPDWAANNNFGTAVSASGSLFAIGDAAGNTYVYTGAGTSWGLQTEIKIPHTAEFYREPVALSGSYLAIGDPQYDNINGGSGRGVVRVYRQSGSTWSLMTAIQGPQSDSNFGAAVALAGSTLVVGASSTPIGNSINVGQVYTYAVSGSSVIPGTTLAPPSTASYPEFGQTLATDGSTIAISSWTPAGLGEVSLFRGSGGSWTLAQRIIDPAGSATDAFGMGLAVSGTTLAISDISYQQDGAVYLYSDATGTWAEQSRLQETTTSGSMAGDFGRSPSLSGPNELLVGTSQNSGDGESYVFQQSSGSWSLAATMSPASGAGADCGEQGSISGTTAVIGCPVLSGIAYVYSP